MWKYLYFLGQKYNKKIYMQKNIMTTFHVKFHENLMENLTNQKKISKKIFHEIPRGTSRYIHGILLHPEVTKL